mgnify:CR=1 FL=1
MSPETLYSAGLIGKPDAPVKLLGSGDADRPSTVRGVAYSASARAKIEAWCAVHTMDEVCAALSAYAIFWVLDPQPAQRYRTSFLAVAPVRGAVMG